ncbi:DinB family protein [Maribacter sp. 2210JD10-5]|uniref:DinB family protein n=1 Tax=Maribacter sp. 2210JD10-5 TaxID=3386272 RepID=UPI0039BCF5DA
MRHLLEITHQNRRNLLEILKNTSREELLCIPDGFRNNLWWNIAHVVVTQQLLVYKMSNLPMMVPDVLVHKFKKGSVPDGTATDEEIEQIKGLLLSTIERTKEDYNKGLFTTFNEYTTSAKVTLRNVDDAIAFNLFHEGLHFGSILALRKMVQ